MPDKFAVRLFRFHNSVRVVRAAPHRNPDGSVGGLVACSARVEPTVTVGPDAQVSGRARVSGTSRLLRNTRVSGHAHISGDVHCCGDVHVGDYARVENAAVLLGRAQVRDRARVTGCARLEDSALADEDAHVDGYAHLSGGAVVRGASHVHQAARLCDLRVTGNSDIATALLFIDSPSVCHDAYIRSNQDVLSGRLLSYAWLAYRTPHGIALSYGCEHRMLSEWKPLHQELAAQHCPNAVAHYAQATRDLAAFVALRLVDRRR